MKQRLMTLAGSTFFCLVAAFSASDAQAHASRHHHGHHHHHYGHHHHRYTLSSALSEQREAIETGAIQSGMASWYGPGFNGRRTANGERFNQNEFTAAHRSLPLGTRVRVVNQRNGESIVVRINDRGPFAHGRIIDLSRASARALGISGTAPVKLVGLS